MKKNVLVTLCDAHFIEQAKQLFSSAHFQGRWKGYYLLLAHEVPKKKTSWFIKRGILVEDCSPLYSSFIGKYPPTLTSKIYLFEEKMKQWKNIIYLDADIIVRGSLEELTKISGFAAMPENDNKPLTAQFFTQTKNKNEKKILKMLKKNYDLYTTSF